MNISVSRVYCLKVLKMLRRSKSRIFDIPLSVSPGSSRVNLVTWSEVDLSRSAEVKEVAKSCVEKVLTDVEDFVGGKIQEKSSCSVISLSPKLVEHEEVEGDHRLANWKRWLHIHEQQSKKIQKHTLRRRKEMLLNTNPNDRRQILNRLDVLEKSSDAFGALNFWKIPEKSKKELHFTLPKSCKAETIPEIIYTQTPDMILKEQKIFKSGTPKPLSRMIQKKFEQRVKLREPSTERLALKGNALGDGLDIFREKRRTFDSLRLSQNKKFQKIEIPQVLVIQGVKVDNVIPDKNILVDLIFKAHKQQRQTQILHLANQGDVAINLTFKTVQPDEVDEILKRPQKVFFFNKFPFRIIPGESLQVPFHFYPIEVGLYQESWVITCDPQFSSECKIIVSLFGHCEKKYKIDKDLESIESEIIRKAAETDVERIIKDVVGMTIQDDCEIRRSKMFNDPIEMEFSLMNPKLFYHLGSVEELEEVFKKIRGKDDQWNFDVDKLYKMILEIADQESQKIYFNRFMTCFDRLKNFRSTDDCDDEDAIKFSLTRNVLGIFFDKFENILSGERAELDQEATIKENLCVAINKIVCILES